MPGGVAGAQPIMAAPYADRLGLSLLEGQGLMDYAANLFSRSDLVSTSALGRW